MAKPVSISLHQFTASVQAAVKAALKDHPKFQGADVNALALGYLIRGFPVPDGILSRVSLAETQAFASDVATQIGEAHPEAFAAARPAGGAVLSLGGHVILGIPAPPEIVEFRA